MDFRKKIRRVSKKQWTSFTKDLGKLLAKAEKWGLSYDETELMLIREFSLMLNLARCEKMAKKATKRVRKAASK